MRSFILIMLLSVAAYANPINLKPTGNNNFFGLTTDTGQQLLAMCIDRDIVTPSDTFTAYNVSVVRTPEYSQVAWLLNQYIQGNVSAGDVRIIQEAAWHITGSSLSTNEIVLAWVARAQAGFTLTNTLVYIPVKTGSGQRYVGIPPAEVPEPLTLLTLGTGLAGLAALTRKRKVN